MQKGSWLQSGTGEIDDGRDILGTGEIDNGRDILGTGEIDR